MNMNTFIQNFSKALKEKNAAIFAGAGLSSGAGFVNWKELLRDVAEELSLNIDKEEDLVGIAQYYCNETNNRGRINQIIIDNFQKRATITENHEILARLPISTFWTTNYDTLIEDALEANSKIVDKKIEPDNLAITVNNHDAIVYKMHGDVSQVQKAIITRDDYEKYEYTHSLFTTALKGDLVSKTFLFIGFSFNDPNLNYILSRVRIGLDKNQRPHYCFLKSINKLDYEYIEDYEYAKAKQDLQINDLKRFSINTIIVNEYSEITDALKKIEIAFKMNNIFISGSAVKYGDFSEEKAIDLIHSLSYEIVNRDCKVISGFGLGVGSYVINGALDSIYFNKKNKIDSNLLLRPFPQKASGDKSLEELRKYYRNEMISHSGIAIFLFGNKLSCDQVINADGLMKEFDIAYSNGVKIIPIGSTGYQTKIIWEEVINNFDKYYPNLSELKPLFEELGSLTDKNTIIKNVITIINKLGRRI